MSSFYGCEFSFDGIPCFEYGLMLYDFNGITEDGKFTSPVKISEDRTSRRYSSLYYGATQNEPLKFSLTFGADINSMDAHKPLDRWELDAIATWLTGHSTYKYLEIFQPDMEAVRYKCIISNLEYKTVGSEAWAFSCEVSCDSPFAYLYPEIRSVDVYGSDNIMLECRAASQYYYPKLKISIKDTGSFSIINHSDGDREFVFSDITTSPVDIYIDNENEVITNSADLNFYKYFNFNFFRLVRGFNQIEIKGNGTLEIVCEFPINVGG